MGSARRPLPATAARRLSQLSAHVCQGAGLAPVPAGRSSARRLAVITGASSGIGQATAEAFAAEGWQVLSLSRSPCVVRGATHRPTDFLEAGWAAQLEAWLREDPEGLVGQGPLQICLVHNAGMHVTDSAIDADIEALHQSLELHVVAPATLNKMFFRLMGPGSSILYIGSTLSEKGVPKKASYVASKHALAGLMKSTCQDLAGTQVHTALICPGFTATKMVMEVIDEDQKVKDFVLSIQTMGRLIEPPEIAAVVRFCAHNPVVNGSVFHVNLGQVER